MKRGKFIVRMIEALALTFGTACGAFLLWTKLINDPAMLISGYAFIFAIAVCVLFKVTTYFWEDYSGDTLNGKTSPTQNNNKYFVQE